MGAAPGSAHHPGSVLLEGRMGPENEGGVIATQPVVGMCAHPFPGPLPRLPTSPTLQVDGARGRPGRGCERSDAHPFVQPP